MKPKRRVDADESLGGLLRRRLGDEATDRAIGPLLGGLYAGDVDQLSVRATFPELQKWEARAGLAAPRRAGRGPQRAAQRRRADVPEAARRGRATDRRARRACRATAIQTDARATAIEHAADGWRVLTSDGVIEADAVVVTVDAPAAAQLLPRDAAAAPLLAQIPFVSTGAVLFVYPRGHGRGPARRRRDSSCRAAPRR